uniref:M13 family metallopeptidase n=1 Tax=Roseihalotalea indica TaxID=2867963 RepID=A0AA49GTV2_9BACT|nr:M13 family metallopeptidase [Tunicatimonas sp. TK19036]
MRHYFNTFLFISGLAGAIGCQSSEEAAEAPATPGINIAYMDTTVSPNQDFYRFVNGLWLDSTEIPADRGRWGGFDELSRNTSQQTLDVLEAAIQSEAYAEDTDQGKAATFYQVAMDTVYLDDLGTEPLQPELATIEAIDSKSALQDYLAQSAPLQNSYFFGFGISADLNNSDMNASYLSPGSLGLPEREYYLKDDEESQRIQEEYRKHLSRMLQFFDMDEAQATDMAERIYEVERRMAQAQMTKEDRRNPLLRNNPTAVANLNQMAPALDWPKFLDDIGAGAVDTVIVTDVEYFKQLSDLMSQTDVQTLKDYLTWTLINESASFLTTEMDQANFDFYGKVLRGVETQRPRKERVISMANRTLGEALGKLYVDSYFPPEAKATALEMVENIREAFGERIKQLEWMSDSTKEKALHKLSTFNVKIGYPDEWKDYSDLEIAGKSDSGSYIGNMINASAWNWERDLAKIGEPVDKSEWFMSPQTVNAYYNPRYNEIVFPAAILQPPFYNYQADPAVNYGGIGAVIGHEISHGFDDGGSRYDADGNLVNWWTQEDRTRFEERTQKLINQYNAYEPLEGVNVNGQYTLGENIGDLGGINVAYDGLQKHLEEHGDPGLIDGYTQEQRFFISWATIWRTKYRDETLKNQINTDPHSPGMMRAIGPISNMTAFYDAFGISESDPLYRPDSTRVYIW